MMKAQTDNFPDCSKGKPLRLFYFVRGRMADHSGNCSGGPWEGIAFAQLQSYGAV